MRRGVILIFSLGLIIVFTAIVVGLFILNENQGNFPKSLQNIYKPSPAPKEDEIDHSINTRKATNANNTTSWIYFSSELYKYSLKYPNNFRIIAGNKNIFQANSKDYIEENGVVTTGAITQVIASDTSDSFEDAWGNIDKTLKNLGVKIISKEEATVDDQPAYKLRLGHEDGTTEIRYLTYKSLYSYKISIVIGDDSQAEMDDYGQILDDIISTFNF